MNMIYSGETLFVDLNGDSEFIDFNYVKTRVFNVLDQYDIENVIINTSGLFNINKNKIASLKRDYYKTYNGNIRIN